MFYNTGPVNPAASKGIMPSDKAATKKSDLTKKAGMTSFNDLLEGVRQDNKLKISAHARQRMESRDINLNENDLKQISDAMDKAGSKGARSSLLLYKDMAFVASVSNKTIITAIDEVEAQEHIFTGIDSAVIVR